MYKLNKSGILSIFIVLVSVMSLFKTIKFAYYHLKNDEYEKRAIIKKKPLMFNLKNT